MRIALICHYLPPHEGGIERVVQHLAAEYASAGHEVSVLAWGEVRRAGQTLAGAEALRGINPLERFGVPVPVVEPVSTLRTINRHLDRGAALHVHGLPYVASMIALRAAARRRATCVVTEHVGLITYDSRVLNRLQSVALAAGTAAARAGASAVTVLNERIGALLTPLVAPVPVYKIANGVDTALFHPSADDEERQRLRRRFGLDRPTVVAVGRNVAKKRLHLVAEAVAGTAVQAVVVGAGTSSLASADVTTHVSLTQAELADLYRAADALALPSVGEGLPLVVQEALASGLPVVVGDDPAVLAELPTVGVLSTPVDDVPALRAACLQAVEFDDAVRHAAAESALRWDWPAAAAEYLRLLGA